MKRFDLVLGYERGAVRSNVRRVPAISEPRHGASNVPFHCRNIPQHNRRTDDVPVLFGAAAHVCFAEESETTSLQLAAVERRHCDNQVRLT